MKIKSEEAVLKKIKILSDIFYILALLCAVYFIIIVLYSGMGTVYCQVWIFLCMLFTLMGHFARKGLVHYGDMPSFIPTFIFTTFALFLLTFVLIMLAVIRCSVNNHDREYVPTDYTIVLGARVYQNGISKTLMYRLEKALEHYSEHPETTLVLTGGVDTGDAIPEALAMFSYFSAHGVPSEKLIIDTSASGTAGTILKAALKIEADVQRRKVPEGPGQHVWPKEYVPTVGIITSDYHMLRSVKIAESCGITDPIPIPARSDKVLFLHQCVRETAAIVKDYLMGNFTLNGREISFSRK